ncbi:radical SAM family heme chaperone HemW [Marinihelvus fidelis]|uniref:Heme chaperone HemW n=1 Tax=Marinihelvus fidelis TaxID=2613842 RepID=A0A5N0T8B6_9GAMM|nr:radical SAM family heme chaperone HemW [Marinihelvus fidelis]KAA9131275.1 radical SAM family heme chaperone HemW [Marinihelvus fidelis]
MSAGLSLPPLGLYVHLPWCVRKCPYCDFNSHALKGELPAEDYIRALLDDLEQDLPLAWGRPVSSVFFGGGTPSLFNAAQMDELLSGIRARIALAPGCEVTLEANPGTVEHDRFSAYRDAGINRVSLGVQSFNDAHLNKLGRIHGSAEVDRAIGSLHDAGLDNFNIDLMYALPGQTVVQALEDIDRAVAAAPAHVSHYQLTLEPNTAFAAAPPRGIPDDDTSWDMQEQSAARLVEGGFAQYEVSAWARPGQSSRHNLNYWRFGDYLGIGAGAHAKLTDPAGGRILRLAKSRHPKRYLAGDRLAETREIDVEERVFEFFLNGLRLRDGFARDAFEARTGLGWETVADRVGQAVERGLLEPGGAGYAPSALGWRFVNDLQALFLPGKD